MALVRVVFKFPMLGGVDTDTAIMVLRAEQYRSSADYARFGVEILLMVFILTEVWMCVRTAREVGTVKYLKSTTNFPHLLNLSLFIIVWGVQARAYVIRPTGAVAFVADGAGIGEDTYVDYRKYGRLMMLGQDMQSFNAFLSYLKVFHYL